MDANGIPYDMWAVVFRNRGDAVVDLVPAPRSPEHSWALARIRVHASMVCASDRKILDGKFPDRVLEAAVKRMLPGGPLKRQQMSNLRIYKGEAHPHEAQSPQKLDIASLNPKNTLRG